MGGRGGSGGDTANWMKAAAGWKEWAEWKYKNPTSYTPDRIDKLVKDFESTNAEYMKRAAAKSKYLSVNPYTHAAEYENDGLSVFIHGTGGGGGGIKSGAVYVDVEKIGEKSKRSFFRRITKLLRLQKKKLSAETTRNEKISVQSRTA